MTNSLQNSCRFTIDSNNKNNCNEDIDEDINEDINENERTDGLNVDNSSNFV
jgi:hypothetical protein